MQHIDLVLVRKHCYKFGLRRFVFFLHHVVESQLMVELIRHRTACFAFAMLVASCCGSSNGHPSVDETPANTKDAIAKTDATVLLIGEQPFFARVIQHNGESFGFLKSLGFNTIQLAATATQQQLQEATACGIWLICPPPSSVGLQPIGFDYDPVIAWTVGDQVSDRHSQIIRETIREIRTSDRRTGRPILASIRSHHELISKLVDIPVIGRPVANSTFPSLRYRDWISARTQTTPKPFWIDLPTHPPIGLQHQALAMSVTTNPVPIQHQQLRFLLYQAITGGGRGIRFLSQQRLDVLEPSTQLRALTLKWAMKHLDQIDPWISGGLVQQLQSPSEKELLHRIRLSDSDLVLVQRTTGIEQHVVGDLTGKRLVVRSLNPSVSDRVYWIDELGARLTPNQRQSTGTEIVFDSCHYTAAAMVTGSPGPVTMVNQVTAGSSSHSLLQNRNQLSQQALAVVQLVQQRLNQQGQPTSPVANSVLGDSIQHLRFAQQMIATGNFEEALKNLELADAKTAYLRRHWLQTRLRLDRGIAVSALLMNLGLIPDHDALSMRMAEMSWNPNALPAGDFENLQQMLDSGWTNRREDLAGIETLVTLEKSTKFDGSYGLKLMARNASANHVIPATPVRVESAKVAVKAGQLVRIHGYIQVPEPIVGHGEGLLIVDSLGGIDLASRIRETDGWQEFTLYRAAERASHVTVAFQLSGFGVAFIDEVTIRTLDVSQNGIEARNAPDVIK